MSNEKPLREIGNEKSRVINKASVLILKRFFTYRDRTQKIKLYFQFFLIKFLTKDNLVSPLISQKFPDFSISRWKKKKKKKKLPRYVRAISTSHSDQFCRINAIQRAPNDKRWSIELSRASRRRHRPARTEIGRHFCRPISGWVRVTGRAGLILSKITGTHERFCESMPDRVPLYLPRQTQWFRKLPRKHPHQRDAYVRSEWIVRLRLIAVDSWLKSTWIARAAASFVSRV